jgi:hypothetical protein
MSSINPQDRAVMGELLGVHTPWTVTDVLVVEGAERMVIIQIEQPPPYKRHFWSDSRQAPVRRWVNWAHAGMGDLRCEISLGLRDGQEIPDDAVWAGEPESPFTKTLSRLVVDLLLDGVPIEQLCNVLRLPFADLWKFKFRLDRGMIRGTGRSAPSTLPPAAGGLPRVLAAGRPGAPADAVPPERSPVWLGLLLGRVMLDVRTLGLKLLLATLQREARMHRDADLHAQAAHTLHEYFVKNAPVLVHEISQLHGALSAALARRPSTISPDPHPTLTTITGGHGHAGDELPAVTEPLWLELLQGTRDLDVRALSLKLLLTKLRSQARAIQDDEIMMLKLVELHRFFSRHKAALHHEISQLQN